MKNKYVKRAAAFVLAIMVACGSFTGCTASKKKNPSNQKPQSSVTQDKDQNKPGNNKKPEKKPVPVKPGQNNSGMTNPGQTKPDQNNSVHTKPGQKDPIQESKPSADANTNDKEVTDNKTPEATPEKPTSGNPAKKPGGIKK